MKCKSIILVFVFLSFFKAGFCQEDLKAFNNLTFYYVDNSSGYQADALNLEMTDELKNNLKKLSARPDNYFFFYACNGQEPKISNSLSSLLEGTALKKYLSKESKESEYSFDKQSLRDNLIEYPVKIKQNVEINLFLSAYAIKNAIKNVDLLPTPVFFPRELPIYLNASASDLKIKMNIYLNKEVVNELGEDAIKNFFTFCSEGLNQQKIQPVFMFL